eukprot:NODE_2239_length_1256_cov_20.609776_g2040_i0.p1 GENE.NODE_2239_length_1256_cov_20.609776_g2040_i0~~NODE_2239_length_1256_cov_20.609776_g2040_i0.p1  ORF type:complete len:299 (+),score=5.01 NODE_2239_length_1256_cov_20.609776_g2040_i0:134-1030(+)
MGLHHSHGTGAVPSSNCTRRKRLVLCKLPPSCRWSRPAVQELILSCRLAPCVEGSSLQLIGRRECPCCLLFFSSRTLNLSSCCCQSICTRCNLAIVGSPGETPPCPYCCDDSFSVRPVSSPSDMKSLRHNQLPVGDYKLKLVRHLISERCLAPCFPGFERRMSRTQEECPICMLFFSGGLNRCHSCRKQICTACALQITLRTKQDGTIACPYCKDAPFCANFGGPRAEAELEAEEAEEMRVEEEYRRCQELVALRAALVACGIPSKATQPRKSGPPSDRRLWRVHLPLGESLPPPGGI